MPSSTDEAFTQEENRTNNLGLDKRRKKAKRSKKTAYSTVQEEDREVVGKDTEGHLYEMISSVHDSG